MICLVSSATIFAQAILTNASPTLVIDFSSSMPVSVGSSPSTAFAGTGFEPNPTTAGRLNSNAWASTGMSDGSLAFGGSRTTGDYARGAVNAAQTTGGFYAYTGLPNSAVDPALMIQPGGSDFTPGTLTLRIQNNGTSSITQLDVSYNIYIRNDQPYSGSFNFSYSADDVSYTAVTALDYTSPEAADANGWIVVPGAPSRSTSITGLNVLPGAYFYIRWSGDDVSGSGSRDEFGLDDISLSATYYSKIFTWTGTIDCAWLTNNNWNPNSSYPGVGAGNNDIARFGATIAANTGIGINMNTLGGTLELGGIEIASSYPGGNFNIGNNSGTVSGILKLNGTSLNAVSNTVIRNASAYDVSINDKSSGGLCNNTNSVTMGVMLNNTTNNIVSVEGAGSVIMNSIISGGNPLEKAGSGTGKLTLNANNTLSGNVTVSAGTLQLSSNPTLASVNTITVKAGGTLQITASQTLTNIILESGATLTVDASRTLTINGTLTVNTGATISTTGTIIYTDPSGALVYNGTGTKTSGIEWPNTTYSVTINSGATIIVNANKALPRDVFLINGILDALAYSLSSTSTTFTINGTVRTANLNGLINSGATGTTFTGYTNGATFTSAVLGTSSTIDYNASSGNQNINGSVDYVNLTASGGGTKTPSTGTDVSGTLSVLDNGTILDGSTYSLGGNTTSLVMTGTSYYKVNGAGSKPDAGGASYNLSANSTIEFTGTSATNVRVSSPIPAYGNIIVSGSNVSLSSPGASIKMQTGTTFTVTSTGIFNVQSSVGFTDAPGAAVSNTNTPTIDLQTGSTINYNFAGNQPVTARNDYKNLTISGSGAKTAASAFSVAETFTRSGDASLATTSPTYAANATLAYVDATAGRTYNVGLEWPTAAAVPTNLTVNLSGTGTRQVIMSGDRTLAGNVALTAGELSINGNTLTANGTFSYGTGTITGSSTSNLTLGGAAVTLNFTQTSAATSSLKNLTLGVAGTAKIGNDLYVYGNIKVNNATAGAMDFDGKHVTLKSLSTGTATIDKLNTSGTNLTGATNVTIERWIPMTNPVAGTGRRYQLLTPTVTTTTTTIQANWMEGGQVTSAGGTSNPVPGYGTHITGSNILANHLDRTQTDQPSLFTTTNGVTPAYTAFTNANGTLNALTGYFLFVRGGRDVSLSLYNTNQAANGWVNLPSSNTTLRATGAIQKGQVNTFTNAFVGGTGAWNLITNPYPAPIDWSLVNRTNVNGSYKYWDPHNGNRGGFIDVDNTGASTPSANGNQYIQPGQAFFVVASGAGTPTITMDEADKAVGNDNTPVFLLPPKNFSASIFYYEGGINRRLADGVRAVFDNVYSPAFNGEEDALDLANWDENMAINRDGNRLVVDRRPEITSKDTMFLLIDRLKVANYELEFTGQSFTNDDISATLIDNFTGGRTSLSTTGTTVVPITVSSNPASAASDRFMVVFENKATPLPIDISSIKAYEENSGVQVDWIMKYEQDMDKYEVEKSTDGRQFVQVGTVLSKGNSSIQVNYGWFDANPAFGDNFYRVKSIEKAGTYKYSDIVRVNIGKGGSTDISMYPNPFEGNGFNLQLNKFAAGTYTLTMYNSLGQQVYNTTLMHGGGSATQFISLAKELAAGNYTVKISGANGSFTRTITKK